MHELLQTYHEPTVSIDQIDQTTDIEEKNRLITERTAEENRCTCTGGYCYLLCPSSEFSDMQASATFQSFLSNLAWDYYYPDDLSKRSTIDLTILEFNCTGRSKPNSEISKSAIELIGRLQIGVSVERIRRHDATHDPHKAINRVGCFDIEMKTNYTSYMDLRFDEPKSDVAKNMRPYYQLLFREGQCFETVWSAKRAMGRFKGMNFNCFVPSILAPHDGFLPQEILSICCQTSSNLYLDVDSSSGPQIITIVKEEKP